jgi:hypothetical protein
VEELIKKVTEKAGINADQAKSAISAVMEFIKTKLPGVGDQITGMLSGGGGGGGGVGDVVGNIRGKLGI